MAGLFEINQTAKREDLLELLTRVDEKATPFLSVSYTHLQLPTTPYV